MKLGILLLSIFIISTTSALQAQPFQILEAGELELESDLITDPGRVTKYFGMNVEGSGESIIRVSAEGQNAEKEYIFQLSATQLFSYFFPNKLSEVADTFRRGVKGTILIEILASDGSLQTSSTLELDVLLPKKNCRKSNGQKFTPCRQADLSKITKKQRLKFLRSFVREIKGPIILEP